MEERLIIQVVGQVMVYDSSAKQWHPAGTSSGLSTVRLIHYLPNNTFRIHGQKINELKEVVLDSQITREVKYNRANDAFIQWHDSQAFWGLNFRRGSPDAESFFASVVQVLKILNQSCQQQQPPPQSLTGDLLNTQPQQSSAIIQRSIQQQQQQQMIQQQAPQQPMLHQQQQPPMMTQQQQAPPQMMTMAPTTQMLQQQQASQQQQLLQQQQLHQHYMQQQQQQQQQQQAPPPPPPPQPQAPQPNHNQINHYQQQQHIPQQQLQQPHQVQQAQQVAAPVVAAPPPPPPPPPPAPPAINNCRINGLNSTVNSSNGGNLQHSPVTNSISLGADNGSANRNGGSPNQQAVNSSLASELAKCQLRKVNLSRSDSEKESECNNNNLISNAKTTRAASLATDNLMNEMNRKLASRREKLDQQSDGHSMSNNNGSGNNQANNTNGICGDKESWLADLIRKEIGKEITKMKAEIIDVIKTELRQR